MAFWRKAWFLWAGLGSIILGYIFLAAKALTLGPLLLVVGYCLLLPIYLWLNSRDQVGE
jgi:hypothetical protein